VREDARKTRTITAIRNEQGLPIGQSTMQLPTGRLLLFKEYYNEWRKDNSFSPTELRNYPVQSYATGDIVPTMLGELYRVYIQLPPELRDKMLPVCTVHDSVVWDVHPDAEDTFIELIPSTMVKVKQVLKDKLDVSFDVAIGVGVTKGVNWLDQHKLFSLSK